jgi:hypothetical protein
MKKYTSPTLRILGTVAAETMASVVKPVSKCSGNGDALAQTIKTVNAPVCP